MVGSTDDTDIERVVPLDGNVNLEYHTNGLVALRQPRGSTARVVYLTEMAAARLVDELDDGDR